tara:strand:- start:729 stop:1484 length:756 start_codon:yes stop_codon:yes gene_type:complete
MYENMSYKIYKNCISNTNSKKIFNLVVKSCQFYCPSLFHRDENYKKTWLDEKFINKIIDFRKNYKKRFSAMYDSIQISNEFQKVLFLSNLDLITTKFLKVDKDELIVRGMQLRMDFPNDKRNSYGWHQDNAYDKYNLYSKNGAVLWIPLVNTNKKNGTLIVKIGSQNSTFECSERFKKGTKYSSEQILVKKKFLKKYKSKSINCSKNSALATYCGIFHKSGNNTSDHIRFTIIIRYNNQFSKDFKHYRNIN